MTAAAIIYSGGFGHPFADSSATLATQIEAAGWTTTIETELGAALDGLPAASLLVVNALRFSMTQAERYLAHRAEFAAEMSDDEFRTLDRFVADGGALLVMHTGTVCWDTQPGWKSLIGGGWDWQRSHHPPPAPIVVTLTAAGGAIVEGPPDFGLIDEVYHHLDPSPDCTVIATAEIEEGPQSIAWTRRHGRGRVAVDALGHDSRSLTEPGHSALIGGLLGWLAEATHASD